VNTIASPFAIQLGIAIGLVLAIAASTLSFALRARKAGAEPVIRATCKELKGWYQVQIAVANQAPYAVIVDELRRVRPRAARLMAPIKQVSTRQGEFQVWSDPASDKARTSIPLDLALGPNEARAGAVARAPEAHTTAWLFFPEQFDPAELVLELAFLDGSDHLRSYRFNVTPEPHG
jgi:hypothetical protein